MVNVSGGKDKCVCHDTVLFPVILRVELLPIVNIRESGKFSYWKLLPPYTNDYITVPKNFKCICVYPFL